MLFVKTQGMATGAEYQDAISSLWNIFKCQLREILLMDQTHPCYKESILLIMEVFFIFL